MTSPLVCIEPARLTLTGARWTPFLPLITLGLIVGCSDSSSPADPNDDPPVEEVCTDPPAGVLAASSGTFAESEGVNPAPILLLTGGLNTNVGQAGVAFLESIDRGNLTILSPGASTQMNTLLWSGLSASPRPGSISTLAIDGAAVGSSEFVLCRVHYSEGLFVSGDVGPEAATLLEVWPEPLRDSILASRARGNPLAGRLIGAMVLGELAFVAGADEIEAPEALMNPLDARISLIESTLAQPELYNHLVEVYFGDRYASDRDREGRLLVLLAHMKQDLGRSEVFGLGLPVLASVTIENGTFRVFSESGVSVSVYRLTGDVQLEAGQPLNLDGIERIQLLNGATGAWPIDFDSHPTVTELKVEAGVIGPA